MNITNSIGPGSHVYGTTIQAGHVGGLSTPLPDTPQRAARLDAQLDRKGPLLALTSAGEAEATISLLRMIADTHPGLADQADELSERIRRRLKDHQ